MPRRLPRAEQHGFVGKMEREDIRRGLRAGTNAPGVNMIQPRALVIANVRIERRGIEKRSAFGA